MYLKQLEFKNIELVNLGTSIKNLDYDEKEAFFDMCYSWVYDDVKKMYEKYKTEEWHNNYNYINETIPLIEDLFHKHEFIYNLGTMIFIASNEDI